MNEKIISKGWKWNCLAATLCRPEIKNLQDTINILLELLDKVKCEVVRHSVDFVEKGVNHIVFDFQLAELWQVGWLIAHWHVSTDKVCDSFMQQIHYWAMDSLAVWRDLVGESTCLSWWVFRPVRLSSYVLWMRIPKQFNYAMFTYTMMCLEAYCERPSPPTLWVSCFEWILEWCSLAALNWAIEWVTGFTLISVTFTPW